MVARDPYWLVAMEMSFVARLSAMSWRVFRGIIKETNLTALMRERYFADIWKGKPCAIKGMYLIVAHLQLKYNFVTSILS